MKTRIPDRADLHYDSVTKAWRYVMGDDLHYGYFDGPRRSLETATRRLTELMLQHAQIQARHRVLDVGCGVGRPGIQLVESAGCAVLGISTSEVGLNIARECATRRGLSSRIQFEKRDAVDTGLESESFDRVWMMESSHLVEDKPALLCECARLLRPGGRMVLCDVIVHREISMVETLRHAHEFDLLRTVFGRAKMSTLDQYREMCKAAKLGIVNVIDISTQTLPTLRRWCANAKRNERKVVRLLGRRGLEDFLAACEVLALLWDRKILGYGLVSASKGLT